MADTILEGCEVLCLTGDLITCPLSPEEQEVCKQRLQYQAGIKEVVEWENEALKGVSNYGWQGYLERRHAKLKEWEL